MIELMIVGPDRRSGRLIKDHSGNGPYIVTKIIRMMAPTAVEFDRDLE